MKGPVTGRERKQKTEYRKIDRQTASRWKCIYPYRYLAPIDLPKFARETRESIDPGCPSFRPRPRRTPRLGELHPIDTHSLACNRSAVRIHLTLVAFIAFFFFGDDSAGAKKPKPKCVEILKNQYSGRAFPGMGLRLVDRVTDRSRTLGSGDFEALAVDDKNGEEAIYSFPSLRKSGAMEKYLAHVENRAASTFRISDYFPAITKTLFEDEPRRRANCLVAALAWFGLTDNLDLHHEDFSKLLKANFVQIKPSSSGTFVPPETLAIWCGKGSDTWAAFHAAVYLGDNIVWHKMGGKKPVYTSLENVMNMYGSTGHSDDRTVMRFLALHH
jgi:hypothetical protein